MAATVITSSSPEIGTSPFSVAFITPGSYEPLLQIKASTFRKEQEVIRIRGTAVGTALSGFKVTTKVTEGGSHADYLVDVDLDTPFNMVPWTSKKAGGISLYQTAASGVFELVIDMIGLNEVIIQAKSVGAGSIAFEVNV